MILMNILIMCNVRDERNNVWPKYFRFDNIDEGVERFKSYLDLKERNLPIYIPNLGNYWFVGEIKLEVSNA